MSSATPDANWPPKLDKARMSKMFERPPSLSTLVFDRDTAGAIPALLARCKYSVRKTVATRGRVGALYVRCDQFKGPDRNAVCKAAFVAGGHTFLLDPEMVIITQTEALAEMCKTHACRCIGAVWERVSETVILSELGPEGARSKTWFCQARPEADQLNPQPAVMQSPGHPGLLAGMRALGVPLNLLASEVDATLYELQV